jgi:hypothetical protein
MSNARFVCRCYELLLIAFLVLLGVRTTGRQLPSNPRHAHGLPNLCSSQSAIRKGEHVQRG